MGAIGSNITVNTLAAGIYQAMITTAAGLIVAIPGYILYHLIIGKIKSHAQEMSYYGNELIDVLSGVRLGSRKRRRGKNMIKVKTHRDFVLP